MCIRFRTKLLIMVAGKNYFSFYWVHPSRRVIHKNEPCFSKTGRIYTYIMIAISNLYRKKNVFDPMKAEGSLWPRLEFLARWTKWAVARTELVAGCASGAGRVWTYSHSRNKTLFIHRLTACIWISGWLTTLTHFIPA